MAEAVVDASVAVPWFLDQQASPAARAVLAKHRRGQLLLVIDRHSLVEVLAVVEKRRGVEDARLARRAIGIDGIRLADVDDDLIEDALVESAILGCRLYDAIPAALARRLGVPLYSADRRAHTACEGVVLLD